MRAIMFANTRSGRAQRWLHDVVAASADCGIELSGTYFDLSPDAVRTALLAAQAEEIDTVLAMGGDGTVGSVAQCLLDGNWKLGVLPGGTSNDFARSLDLPLDVSASLKTVAAGHLTRVDVG